MNTTLKSVLSLLLVTMLSACGSDSDLESPPESPSFASTLEPSVYKNGEWDYSNITIKYNVYDSNSSVWAQRILKTTEGSLTLSDNGLSGTTSISSINDGTTSLTAEGETLDGFTVGEELLITGYIDGTTTGLLMTAISGMTVRLIAAPYDGEIIEDPSSKWIALDYWDGVAQVSVQGSVAGADSYVSDPVYDDTSASTDTPSAIEVPIGSGESAYIAGTYTGTGSTYMSFYSDEWDYEEIEFDMNITINENAVTGTLTLTALDDMPSIDGYGVGDSFEVTGTVAGEIITITCTDPENDEFSWRHILGNRQANGRGVQEQLGMFTKIEAYYGVTYRTIGTFGGENYMELNLQVSE